MLSALPAYVPVAVTTRGEAIESVHYGSLAVADMDGRIRYAAGDPRAVVFTRSSLKPVQAAALVAHAGFDSLGLDAREIAVICASHSGEPRHVEAVLSILKKAGCRKEDLQCGVHAPLYLEALGQQPAHGDVFTPVQHNCSGKHAGMIALARLLDAPVAGYLDPDHPVQQHVRAAVAWFTGVGEGVLVRAVDGCSAPNYAVPLAALARAFARLGSPAPDPRYGSALQRVSAAMVAHPEMVAGLKRLDLALMYCGRGDWVAKSGAEGVQALAVRSRGWGVAVKIADGAARAREVVAVEALHQLGLLADRGGDALAGFASAQICNWRGRVTGTIQPVFRLEPVCA